jgi:hypothetical protein
MKMGPGRQNHPSCCHADQTFRRVGYGFDVRLKLAERWQSPWSHCSGDLATEVVHIGLVAMMCNASANLFDHACYKSSDSRSTLQNRDAERAAKHHAVGIARLVQRKPVKTHTFGVSSASLIWNQNIQLSPRGD